MAEEIGRWPLRAWLLAALGAAAGLAAYLLLTGGVRWQYTSDPLRIAGATWIVVSGIVFAFVLERQRVAWAAIFALVAGFVVASVAYWSGDRTSGTRSDRGGW